MFVIVDGCPVSVETDEEKAKDYADHLYGSYLEVKPSEGKFEWFHGTGRTIDSGWNHRSIFKTYEEDEEFLVRDDGSTYARALTEARVREILTNGGL